MFSFIKKIASHISYTYPSLFCNVFPIKNGAIFVVCLNILKAVYSL